MKSDDLIGHKQVWSNFHCEDVSAKIWEATFVPVTCIDRLIEKPYHRPIEPVIRRPAKTNHSSDQVWVLIPL